MSKPGIGNSFGGAERAICFIAIGMRTQSHTGVCSLVLTLGGFASCPFCPAGCRT